jgi:hypothetical protein
MAQERAILNFGRVPIIEALKGVTHRFSEERARRQAIQKSKLRGYALEAIDIYGAADAHDVREIIVDQRPNPRDWSNGRAPAVREVWQALLELQRAGVLECKTVDPPSRKEKARFVWSRVPEETPTAKT